MTPLRVIYMGTPQFAVPTLEALLASPHTVCGVVTQPDRRRGRGQQVSWAPVKALALSRGLPVVQPDRLREPDVEATLRGWTPDLAVVAAYGRIIPESLLTIPRFGTINVHASLLPRWRGAAPIHRAVIAGDTETGVTIMRVVKALDAGAMFARVTRPIGPDETSEAVEHDLAHLGARLLVSVVDEIATGRAHETPQDDSLVTYASRLTKDEGLIEWSAAAAAIHNRVRGLHPWPHAFTWNGDRRLIILRSRLTGAAATAPPGTVTGSGPHGLEVAAGDEVLVIEQVQLEGKRPMHVRDLLTGHRIQPGTRFTGPPSSDTATDTP